MEHSALDRNFIGNCKGGQCNECFILIRIQILFSFDQSWNSAVDRTRYRQNEMKDKRQILLDWITVDWHQKLIHFKVTVLVNGREQMFHLLSSDDAARAQGKFREESLDNSDFYVSSAYFLHIFIIPNDRDGFMSYKNISKQQVEKV